ncbi:MAG: hypothetical protein C0505_19490 [Leptothrix sp. (in: Bacteria)]|nr:hypothetical protein [Leptothrix sp. (in: b-proteobacteria)]
MLTWAAAASGQTSKSESAEADAAMERAKRAAAGPLKAIQQAAKIRRRGETDAPPAPAGSAAPAVISSSAAVPAAVVAAQRPAEAATAPPPALVLESTPAALGVTEVAPLAAAAPAATAVSLPALVTARTVPELLRAVPKALSLPEPAIPPRLLALEANTTEVEAELNLRADGSVEAVRLLPPVPRSWQRFITAALEQWRFEPMSGPAVHRVRLVFKAEGR